MNIVSVIEEYLDRQFQDDSGSTQEPAMRVALTELPREIAYPLFGALTSNGNADWETGTKKVVVALISDKVAESVGNAQSQFCSWDYAVHLRNSTPYLLVIAPDDTVVAMPESISTAARVLSASSTEDRGLLAHLVHELSLHCGVLEADVHRVVQRLLEELTKAARLPAGMDLWSAFQRAFGTSTDMDAFTSSFGLPHVSSNDFAASTLIRLLERLGELASDGFGFAQRQLLAANSELANSGDWTDVSSAIDGLFLHLMDRAGSASDFKLAPMLSYRPDSVTTNWWLSLEASRLQRLVDQAAPVRTGRLSLRCKNGVGPIDGDKGIQVVESEIFLQASTREDLDPGVLRWTRRVPRVPTVSLSGDSTEMSDSPPEHNAPVTYVVAGQRVKPAQVKVVSLATFGPRGLVWVDGADITLPKAADGGRATQTVTVDREARFHFYVHCAPTVKHIRVKDAASLSTLIEVKGHKTDFARQVTGDDRLTLELELASGENRFIDLEVEIEEGDKEAMPSVFQSMIAENQDGKSRRCASVPSALLDVERLLVKSDGSWQPIRACWKPRDMPTIQASLAGGWGPADFRFVLGPPPDITPPREFLDARDGLLALLRESGKDVAEHDLDKQSMRDRVAELGTSFGRWLEEDESAAWSDSLVLYAPVNTAQDPITPSAEPIALLLSPLHPLRLAWHSVAQRLLRDALRTRRCAGADILDPHSCPGVLTLPLYIGSEKDKSLSFYPQPCSDKHWMLFWSESHIPSGASPPDAELGMVSGMLMDMDVRVIGGPAGMSEPQARRALNDIQRVLPTRRTLRIGLIGNDTGSGGCVDGIVRWSENEVIDASGANEGLRCEVYDDRPTRTKPSSGTLATLAQDSRGRVRWYSESGAALRRPVDIAIFDQLDAMGTGKTSGPTRSATTIDGVVRIPTRDTQATWLRDSAVAGFRGGMPDDPLSAVLRKLVEDLEQRAVQAGSTHTRSRPVTAALEQQLSSAAFLAITSSHVDPAFIGRAAAGEGAYIWDYELPTGSPGQSGGVGYYLLAKPLPSMLTTIDEAAKLVCDNASSARDLLAETASRGIPMIKRLTTGGSHARGEIGMLLATRLLQDAFRTKREKIRLPVTSDQAINLIVPVDPYWERLAKIAFEPRDTEQRGDLMVVSIDLSGPSLRITPVEVKFRGTAMADADLADALGQARQLGKLLRSLWEGPYPNSLWELSCRALLAQCLGQAFRTYDCSVDNSTIHGLEPQEWAARGQEISTAVLTGEAEIFVLGHGVLLAFDNRKDTELFDADGDAEDDTLLISAADARALLCEGSVSPLADTVIDRLKIAMGAPSSARPTPVGRADTENTGVEDAPIPPEEERPEEDDHAIDEIPPVEIEQPQQEDNVPVQEPAVPEEVRQVVNQGFIGFVGNEQSVRRIKRDLLVALISSPRRMPKNILLLGVPSTGKTELARRIAGVLGLPFVRLDGRGLDSRERLFKLIRAELEQDGKSPKSIGTMAGLPIMEYPPFVVFVDEVHLVPRTVQESLLTMLEQEDRMATLKSEVASVKSATFLFATTRASELDPAFRSRCSEINLIPYSNEEVATIVRLSRGEKPEWPDEIYRALAVFGRSSPRVALELASELENEILVTDQPGRSIADHLAEIRSNLQIDDLGLRPLDLQYLTLLEREGRPLGENAIVNMLPAVDRNYIIDEVEPFLRHLDFIRLTGSGRELTLEGRGYLVGKRREDARRRPGAV